METPGGTLSLHDALPIWILSSRAENESLGGGLSRTFFAAMRLGEDLGRQPPLDRWRVRSYPLNMRQVLIHPGEDGYWVAECPSLPGCVSQGATREESIRNIQEAIEGYIAVLREDGLPVPEDKLEALLLAV